MLVLLAGLICVPQQSVVTDYGSLRYALSVAKPGTTILLAPGDYSGGSQFENIHGAAGKPVIIGAQDPKRPPRIVRGGWHLVASSHVEIRDLWVVGPLGNQGNGINVDDGGVRAKPSHHITLRRIRATGIGTGAIGLKMAGVDQFAMIDCDIRDYGVCGIDFVGCHDGVVENCRLENGEGVGVQAKGASSNVVVRNSRFKNYGGRGVNIGGSTGDPYFRPPFESIAAGSRYEAKNMTVEGCTFEGGDAAVAFINCDGSVFQYNTIVNPSKWAIRILQETPRPDFHPSRNGVFKRNLVAFRSDRWFEGGVNVGPNTSPSTFKFAENFWFCLDRVERSQPTLPSTEVRGVVGRDPMFADLAGGDFSLKAGSPAVGYGATALPRTR